MELNNSEAHQENETRPDFENFIANYKIPLVFGIVGATFLIGAVILTFKQEQGIIGESIQITQEAQTKPQETYLEKIKVDVQGAVSKAGVYNLFKGSRISDILFLAGGISQEADQNWINKNLNLAQKLTDGSKIYIPTIDEGQNQVVLGSQSEEEKININSATKALLMSLPGIGEVRAQKIIEGRPYQQIEDLLTKKIVGQSVFEEIKDKIRYQ